MVSDASVTQACLQGFSNVAPAASLRETPAAPQQKAFPATAASRGATPTAIFLPCAMTVCRTRAPVDRGWTGSALVAMQEYTCCRRRKAGQKPTSSGISKWQNCESLGKQPLAYQPSTRSGSSILVCIVHILDPACSPTTLNSPCCRQDLFDTTFQPVLDHLEAWLKHDPTIQAEVRPGEFDCQIVQVKTARKRLKP